MRLYKNIFIYILFNINSFSYENYSLIFPFNHIAPKDPDIASINKSDTLTINKIMKNIFLNEIYIQTKIGSPPQNINVRISVNSEDFFITKSKAIFEVNYPKKDGNYYFDQNISSTFSIQPSKKGNIFNSNSHLSEYVNDYFTFYFSNSNEKNNVSKNLDFLLAYKVYGPNHGLIGLKHSKSDIRREDFFTTLKKNNIIKNYIWYFNYENEFNGSLIIGNYPHDDENIIKQNKKEFLKKYNFIKIYSKITKENWSNNWGIKFDKIYLRNTTTSPAENEEILNDCENCKISMLNPNIGVIIGTKKYKFILEKIFLNKYLNKKICFQPILKFYKNYKEVSYYYYYCNASYIEEMKKEFMPIIFEHKSFKFNFTLNFEDLFIQKGDYIFSKIIFNGYYNLNWILGAPFFSKYLFIFNSESKEIGFYSSNVNNIINEEKIINNNRSNLMNIVKKIILGLFLIFIGIIIGKKLFGLRRKLRANELEEKFEYKPAENKKQLISY